MGIWDRLGNVLKSYLNDDHEFQGKSGQKRRYDPDLDAAYEELDDFLRGDDSGKDPRDKDGERETEKPKRPVPDEIKQDLAELGLPPEASAQDCKEAYKKLLKIHHPDRHAGNPENLKKATQKTARVNAAYDRLVNWFRLNSSV